MNAPADLRGESASRLIARHAADFIAARGLMWQAATCPDRFDCLVLQVILSGNIAHLPYLDRVGGWLGIDCDDAQRRPLSVMAIARSMHLPYETVRRRTRALIEMGLVVGVKQGLVVPAAIFAQGEAAALADRDVASFQALIDTLARRGHRPSVEFGRRGTSVAPADVVARPILEFTMRSLEDFTRRFGDLITGSVFVSIITANVRPIMADADLARRFAGSDQTPPDDLRVPVAIRPLARMLELPFETVRRRVAELVEEGFVVSAGGGLIVPKRVLDGAGFRGANIAQAAHLERALTRIARINFAQS